MLHRDKAVHLLEMLAEGTWQRLDHAARLGVSQGEETVTDLHLLEIARFGAPELLASKCPKHLEAKRGIDWDFLVGNNTQGWRRYAVQAKKVDPKNSYSNLNHHVKNKLPTGVATKRKQMDLLFEYANQRKAFPTYCFYNHVEVPDYRPYWQCCMYSVQPEQLGCTVTPASVVQKAVSLRGARNFTFLHKQQETIPWRCLALCPRFKHYPSWAAPDPNWFRYDSFHQRMPWDLHPLSEGEQQATFEQMYNEYGSVPARIAIIGTLPN